MKKPGISAPGLAGLCSAFLVASAISSPGAVIREDFALDPGSRGWVRHGDGSLFNWDPAGQRLATTWDSTRTNSFFCLPLGTILTRRDDFRFALTLDIDEISTASPEGTFQLAVGFLRRSDAFQTNFFRGAGIHPLWGPRNTLEFDYFPASSSITPTLSAVAVNTSNLRWATVDLFPFELTGGDRIRVTVTFQASDQTLTLLVTRNGLPLASGTTLLRQSFGDFRLDAFSVTSYSGDHQPAGYDGQILARGWVDDIELEFPDPPVTRLSLSVDGSGSHLSVPAVASWWPRFQRSTLFPAWEDLPGAPVAEGELWRFSDPPPPPPWAAYRVVWERP